MAETIEHEGTVIAVKDSYVIVTIESQSACATCHAKGACGQSEMTNKHITAERPNFPIAVGDKVIVSASNRSALLSVLFAYLFPSAVIIAILAVLLRSGLGETWAAIFTLIVIVIYFIIIYLFRNKFAKKIKFKVRMA